MNIGIYFGGFHPLHRGHMSCIIKAMHENDKVYVIVCGYDNDPRAIECGIDLNTRTKLIKDFYKDEPRIHVFSINDTELGIDQSQCIDNWIKWTNNAEQYIQNISGSDNKITYYVSEPEYVKSLNQIGKQTVLMERQFDISGTKIRKYPQKYWKYIAQPFKKYFVKKFVVIGTASEGKSTLVRKVSKYFDIPMVPELARNYIEKENIHNDENLKYEHFCDFLNIQHTGINVAINKAAEKSGIMIADTENLITLMYAKAYSEMEQMNINAYHYSLLEQKFNELPRIEWDTIFFLMPNEETEFEDDGSRYMVQSTIEERIKNFNILHDLILKYYPDTNVIYLNGSKYEANFDCVKGHINYLNI